MEKFDYLKSINTDYIEELFDRYSQDPESIDSSWRYFFEGLELGQGEGVVSNGNGSTGNGATHFDNVVPYDTAKELKVAELILAYRMVGKELAKINPLEDAPLPIPELELSRFGLTTSDMSRNFQAGYLVGGTPAPLSKIIEKLRVTYCGDIAAETSHIENRVEREWVQSKIENGEWSSDLDSGTRKHIYRRLVQADSMERFLGARYVGEKRFSLEGGDALIPGLDCLFETAASLGATDFVLGMAHRGRLNVLVNIFGKKLETLFTEFDGTYKVDTSISEGDVKYHMGASADVTTRNGKTVHLSLASNASHLEFVNPVVEGMVRAKQFRLADAQRTRVVPILIHGDAAFAGQGVCYETLNFMSLKGYSTGGTIHIVVNNQVGFTTDPVDSRSTRYCTDVIKMLEVPIFHVNGDKPEAIWRAMKCAMEYRQKFHKDVAIDIVCYRKHGHNEGDEPAFTQPSMYRKIKAHLSPRELYAQNLSAASVLTETEAQAEVDQENARLAKAHAAAKEKPVDPEISVFNDAWKGLKRGLEKDLFVPVQTTVSAEHLRELSKKINSIPSNFKLNPKLGRLFEARLKAVTDGAGIDWGCGEALAYATLLDEGHSVRISGQDVERGTFTHRHAVLSDYESGAKYTPHEHVRSGQGIFQIHNSHLSETGVLGFEFGYSLADPKTLVVWEAQFGDFGNGAQVIIDQFIAAAESKWQRMSGICLFLPHGYEGQGPEHSSARLERYLQLCGRSNMNVLNLTTPAQLFHAVRRQLNRDFRKPMILMSPKSLLRHPQAVSKLSEFSDQGFQEVIDDSLFSKSTEASQAERVLICSGKVYYDLLAAREQKKISGAAIVRLEQLYPWPAETLAKVLGRYSKAKKIIWVQEEPRNMGAWTHVVGHWNGALAHFAEKVGGRMIGYVGRETAAAPAVGSKKAHAKEQEALVNSALTE